MTESASDEFSARELGVKIGRTWAELAPMRAAKTSSPEIEVATVAESGAVPDEVREVALRGMGERLAGRGDERAFLEGFVHGVRTFLEGAETGATRE